MERYVKVYTPVILRADEYGNVRPVAVEWSDGRKFEIEKILDCRNAPPEHTGGVLTKKYRVRISGAEKVIYTELQTGRWFVEKLV